MAIKDRIKEARLNKKLTQEELAKRIGVAKSTVTGYEKGNSEPNIETLGKIMSVLDVDANFLWQDETDFPIQVSYVEMQHIKKYRVLDEHGKDVVDIVLDKEYIRCENAARPTTVTSFPQHVLNAAHDDGATEEQKINADNIMDNDNEWK